MLTINVRGENIEVTSSIREYVEKRLSKMEKYFSGESNPIAHVNLKTYPSKGTKVEVTIPLPYITLRAEEVNDDLYAGIDLVVDKLERQVKKFKTRVNRKSREGGSVKDLPLDDITPDDTQEDASEIVRTKRLSLKPMDAEEAVLQMEMLGHEFFIFEDSETNGASIVYKRNDGKYGLIETNE
ncbi:ribosome hibernation-promoting factor, HPF/YfiA family [Companilactobacillus halodurans]|uniref:Ribosome hibernation promoting factor n=1 Tax=Companilactobacillus halodurans TaxID=2584183 RepID=A0A5P0ZUS6_9LACO|nr:ribosome-associated translation inhibitor RaiA [Companilactobacillus halodurans]MQS75843.1 ribosome-associated translation inhibitor RaiA [Companilactobacillus halodurans]MQS96665.1 ribosome-associated translation inhibitor RaiA [Companilactobacillus halodurans]